MWTRIRASRSHDAVGDPAHGVILGWYDDAMTSTGHDHPRADELPPPRTEEVADRVYAYIQPDGGWWINNTGFVLGERHRAVHRQLRHRTPHPRLSRRRRRRCSVSVGSVPAAGRGCS